MEHPQCDRVVLVTGGAKRVGAAICRRLHASGARLAIHYRSSRREAEALAAELEAARPGSVLLLQADLLDPEAPARLVDQALARFGAIHVLINNASSFFPTTLGEIDEGAWRDLIGTNLKAPLFLTQAAAAALRETCGTVVNITDIHAERPLKGYVVYSMAKAGLVALTRSLAHELAPCVRVNAVAPGTIVWPEDGQLADPESRRHILDQILLQREGEPDDIARTVQFLIEDAPYLTGQVIAVDGGRNATL